MEDLFRPFVGFKDIRLVHKEPRHSSDRAYVLCFVEFSDAKCAITAMEALQEYRFDERKPDAAVLNIKFARNLEQQQNKECTFVGLTFKSPVLHKKPPKCVRLVHLAADLEFSINIAVESGRSSTTERSATTVERGRREAPPPPPSLSPLETAGEVTGAMCSAVAFARWKMLLPILPVAGD
ncbi:hypothetical protein OsJ_20123 [Oryza sativa Japonica Group]|uniref:RRM domain-containing protein n=1 Tax=Oryza sativa subsp. japonica TaxID=39947 RepID=B9FRH3_ORYSJ|nr:hypothetical protein OsJ_20123 [Oryza sativa Japonica Group]